MLYFALSFCFNSQKSNTRISSCHSFFVCVIPQKKWHVDFFSFFSNHPLRPTRSNKRISYCPSRGAALSVVSTRSTSFFSNVGPSRWHPCRPPRADVRPSFWRVSLYWRATVPLTSASLSLLTFAWLPTDASIPSGSVNWRAPSSLTCLLLTCSSLLLTQTQVRRYHLHYVPSSLYVLCVPVSSLRLHRISS